MIQIEDYNWTGTTLEIVVGKIVNGECLVSPLDIKIPISRIVRWSYV
jgi:hypothetical protein